MGGIKVAERTDLSSISVRRTNGGMVNVHERDRPAVIHVDARRLKLLGYTQKTWGVLGSATRRKGDWGDFRRKINEEDAAAGAPVTKKGDTTTRGGGG